MHSPSHGYPLMRWPGILAGVAVAVLMLHSPEAVAASCRPRTERHTDPNTGQSWSQVWYCGNDASAKMYADPNDSTPVATMQSTNSWFVCYRRGEQHSGGNNVWYYSQGDTGERHGWGYMPAVNVWTSTDPYPGIPECQGASPPPPPPPSAGNYKLPLPHGAFVRTIGSLKLSHSGHNYWASDLMVTTGTPVYSVSNGVVSNYSQGTCGNGLTVRGDDGLSYLYCHGSRYAGVKSGQRVSAGQIILYSGNTGRSGAPHLHLEIKKWVGDWDSAKAYCTQRFLRSVFNGQPRSPTNFPASGDCKSL